MNNLPIPQSRIEVLMNAFISRDSSQISAPQSRIEEFWYHLIEGTNALPIPQSRIELLLKKIIENDTEQIPLTKSRVEEFLVSILIGDTDKLPIPQSRSECYLDYIAQNNLMLDDDVEYVTYSGTNIKAANTAQKPLRRATLKGHTGYRDIDTGEILETFEEGRNLELVSVRMPVLLVVGKNWCSCSNSIFMPTVASAWYFSNGERQTKYGNNLTRDVGGEWFYLSGGIYTFSYAEETTQGFQLIKEFESKNYSISNNSNRSIEEGWYTVRIKSPSDSLVEIKLIDLQIEQGSTATYYEEHKSNILSCNEEVILRSKSDIYDELNALTGQLIQRIDEDNEILAEEIIKTVVLKVIDQGGNLVKQLSTFDETTHIVSSSASDNSLIAIAEVEVPTKLIEALDSIKSLSSDVEILINEVDNAQKLQDENSTMVMSTMTELYEMVLMIGGGS